MKRRNPDLKAAPDRSRTGRASRRGRAFAAAILGCMVLALLLSAAEAGPARADAEVALGVYAEAHPGVKVGASSMVVISDGPDACPPPPRSGRVEVELWSDPAAGSVVHPGDRARVYFRAGSDCYVTLFSVDTEGRVRLIFPPQGDDGWVRGGRTYRLPGSRAQRLVFTGPTGIEYLYALASLEPVRHRYPYWLMDGRVWDPDRYYGDDGRGLYDTGYVVGDPFYQVHEFCRALVPNPDWTDTYSTAYVYFHVGRKVHYPRYVCSDCHWGGWIDPYGPSCSAVTIHIGDTHCRGWIDFRLLFVPTYTYRVHHTWRPRWWRGDRWDGPDGRWVWSSADLRRGGGGHFAEARPGGRDRPAYQGGTKPDRPYHVTRDGERKPDSGRDRDGWERAHRERLEEKSPERRDGGNAAGPRGVPKVEPRGRSERGSTRELRPPDSASPRGGKRDEGKTIEPKASRSRASDSEKKEASPDRASRQEKPSGDRGRKSDTPKRR